MANSRFYSSIAAVTNLQSTAGPSDVTIQVASSSGFPNSFPFTLSLDYGSANEELVDVTGGGPSVFNVTRAVDSTSASTHNAGAVVRHVSSARDFTDSRTHEASSSNVHGITGSFVDTQSVQTINNKTLTAPVINSGTLNGTLGAGGATISGTPTFSQGALARVANTATPAWQTNITGDTQSRVQVNGDGSLNWGTGNAASDTNLYRKGPSLLATDDQMTASLGFTSTRPFPGNYLAGKQSADTNDRIEINEQGDILWGTGSAALDTTLSRTGTATLTVSSNLVVPSNITAGTVNATGSISAPNVILTGQTWTSFTPVWSNANATMSSNQGYYTRLGKLIFFNITTVFSGNGSGSTVVRVDAPTNPDRSLRQFAGTVWFSNVNTSGGFTDINCMGQYETSSTDSGTTTLGLVNYKSNQLIGTHIQNGTTITVQGWYREL